MTPFEQQTIKRIRENTTIPADLHDDAILLILRYSINEFSYNVVRSLIPFEANGDPFYSDEFEALAQELIENYAN